jgi:hypothetical protein
MAMYHTVTKIETADKVYTQTVTIGPEGITVLLSDGERTVSVPAAAAVYIYEAGSMLVRTRVFAGDGPGADALWEGALAAYVKDVECHIKNPKSTPVN